MQSLGENYNPMEREKEKQVFTILTYKTNDFTYNVRGSLRPMGEFTC